MFLSYLIILMENNVIVGLIAFIAVVLGILIFVYLRINTLGFLIATGLKSVRFGNLHAAKQYYLRAHKKYIKSPEQKKIFYHQHLKRLRKEFVKAVQR